MIDPADLLVSPGSGVRLADIDPRATPGEDDKGEGKERLAGVVREIADLQELLWAENRRSLLVVLQGMDTCGKDGLIRDVFSGVNPQGCRVHAFKAPTPAELEHDFLWRVHARTPPRGEIAVFNRSHYEDVLVARVRGLAPAGAIEPRYGQINDFEQHLAEHGTAIIKLFLHISKDEQRERLRARLEDPAKHWKFSPRDLGERKRWDAYMRAYEIALERCSTDHAPWHIIPSDRKWYRNIAAAGVILSALREMDPRPPEPGFDPDTITIPD